MIYYKEDYSTVIGQIKYYLNITEKERRWGFHVTTAGHATIEPNESYPPKGHPRGYDFKWENGRQLEEFGVLYLAGGRGTFESASQSPITLETGNAVILFPGEWHRYRPDPETGWEEYWVHYGG